MYTVGKDNIPLCLDCYFKVFQIQQAQTENYERQINFYSDEVDHALGFPPSGPRFPERKAIHVQGTTLNNIKINNSIVGSVNTGTIGSLDIAITSIKKNDANFAEALTKLSEAVLKSALLSNENKEEILEIMSALASEKEAPKERQRKNLSKTLYSRLQELVGLASDLGSIWAQWGPIIAAPFNG